MTEPVIEKEVVQTVDVAAALKAIGFGEAVQNEDGTFDLKTPDGQLLKGQKPEDLPSLVAKGADYTRKTQKLSEERKANEAKVKGYESLQELSPIADIVKGLPDEKRASFLRQLEGEVKNYLNSDTPIGDGAAPVDTAGREALKRLEKMEADAVEAETQRILKEEISDAVDSFEWAEDTFKGDVAEAKAIVTELARKGMMFNSDLDATEAVKVARERLLKSVKPKGSPVEKAKPGKVLSGSAGTVAPQKEKLPRYDDVAAIKQWAATHGE